MKRILGLDLGTNSIGWALTQLDFEKKEGNIEGLGSRIIPMSQDIMGLFDSGQSHSQTANRTAYRGTRRLYQRDNSRRERLHRVLNVLGVLPEHYSGEIDFDRKLGQFKKEVKLNYREVERNGKIKSDFIFIESFNEMVDEFAAGGNTDKMPYDWTLYYLRKKSLTEKITKEELAWIILNFNQKRGYYQLRGDELQVDDDKNQKYYALEVKAVEATEDRNAKGIWYNVILENDWVYRRQSKDSLDAWIGMTKEFIVTTKTDKEGNEKRSFKAPKESDWGLVKKKTEQEIDEYGKHIGVYIYEKLLTHPRQKIRGKLIKTIERKYYKKELEAILTKQVELNSELFTESKYEECVNELYPNNQAHRAFLSTKDFIHLFVNDIIFYQRPLKSKKSTIAGCQLEKRSFFKSKIDPKTKKEIQVRVTEPVKTISKSHPSYQEFRLWQFLSNMKVIQIEDENGNLLQQDQTSKFLASENDWVELFDFFSEKKEIEQKHLLDFLVKKERIQKKEKKNFGWNYSDESKFPCFSTRGLFVSRLSKVKGIDPIDFLTAKTWLGKKEPKLVSREEQLWHIVYSVKELEEFEKALKKFAAKHEIDEETFVASFIKTPPFQSDYGAFSLKAIEKLLPLIRRGKYWNRENIDPKLRIRIEKIINGEFDEKIRDRVREKSIHLTKMEQFRGLPLWLASYIIYDRHSEGGDIQKWNTPDDIDAFLDDFKQHSLRNPIVEQVVTEALRTVRDIWRHFGQGEEKFFDEIHIELGREMKNPAKKRKSISEQNRENERTNQRIRALLQELKDEGARDYSPSHQEILKIYEEGVVKSINDLPDYISKIRKSNSPTKVEMERYKLWLEQKYISPYTGLPIPLSKLFTTDYQIEHIIPQSRYFDNSLSNKVICESELNQLKDNQTAYEFIKNYGGDSASGFQILGLAAYESHCNKYFKSSRTKLKNLLSEDIPEGFINRQLNDSRYISKLVNTLMSNIVRETDEQEVRSKHIVTVTGSITSRLKRDWGLNDKWNEIIAPRFQRLNEMFTKEGEALNTDFGYWDNRQGKRFFRTQVPEELAKGFSKKRIDHRHHALDALVVACCTADHVNYITSLNTQRNNFKLVSKLRKTEEIIKDGKKRRVAKEYLKPWNSFPVDVKAHLEKTVVSFKQNTRVINKTNNKYWSYKDEKGNLRIGKDGKPLKKLTRQIKGDNWAIRKPLHKETVAGKLAMEVPKGKIATAVRTSLLDIKNQKHIDKITDKSIQAILNKHLERYKGEGDAPNFELAFSPEGIKALNEKIISLNNGKNHQPIYKARQFEIGSRFAVGVSGNKSTKYVEAAKGTNLFFAIYQDENGSRNYDTVPLNEVIEHQKQVAALPKSDRSPVPVDSTKGRFLFSLSPNDLVYVPTDEEMDNPHLVDFNLLTKTQISRIVAVNDFSGGTCYFTPHSLARSIAPKEVDLYFDVKKNKLVGSFDVKTARFEGVLIKERCWKLNADRLGNLDLLHR